MRVVACIAGLLVLLAAALPAQAPAADLEQGINQAAVISFPTALNQPTTNNLATTVELTDIAKPKLNLYNIHYGFQHGAFQLINDLNFSIEPTHEFDYGQIRAKLQVLSLDEYRSYVAVGLLGRAVRHSDERQARIDNKTASLFAVSTFEIFPFQNWGGFLFNVYLDNRFLTLGTKIQLYQSIQFVGEAEHLISTKRSDKNNARLGVSFEGEQNAYFQILWTDQGKHWLAQIGTGF